MPHDHKYIIADDQAVQVLLNKMLGGGTRQKRREKLLKALDEASRHYAKTNQKERQAFFHGLRRFENSQNMKVPTITNLLGLSCLLPAQQRGVRQIYG